MVADFVPDSKLGSSNPTDDQRSHSKIAVVMGMLCLNADDHVVGDFAAECKG